MNTKQAMRAAAPDEICAALELPKGTSISVALDCALQLLASRTGETLAIVEKFGDVQLDDNRLRAICAHAWPFLEPEMRAYLNAIGLAAPPKPGEVRPWTSEQLAAEKRVRHELLEKLLGTPAEQAEKQRLRELAYRLSSTVATREELNRLLEAGIIREPPQQAVIIPAVRLPQ